VVPTVTEAHDNVPEPVIVAAVLLPAEEFKVTVPLTASVIPELTVNVADAPEKVRDAHDASAVTVQTAPFANIAAVPDPGIPALHLAASDQFPDPEKVDCPQTLIEIESKATNNIPHLRIFLEYRMCKTVFKSSIQFFFKPKVIIVVIKEKKNFRNVTSRLKYAIFFRFRFN
jgi:hypothetical protein